MSDASLTNLLGRSGLSLPVWPGLGPGTAPPAPGRAEPLPPRAASRTRLHELHASLHCSIVGTCFGLRELRQLVVKFAEPDLAKAGDHTIHTEAVRHAGRRDGLGRMLGKTLDRKFKTVIGQFAKAGDVVGLRRLWLDGHGSGSADTRKRRRRRGPARTAGPQVARSIRTEGPWGRDPERFRLIVGRALRRARSAHGD